MPVDIPIFFMRDKQFFQQNMLVKAYIFLQKEGKKALYME